jgi:hypothetical protein
MRFGAGPEEMTELGSAHVCTIKGSCSSAAILDLWKDGIKVSVQFAFTPLIKPLDITCTVFSYSAPLYDTHDSLRALSFILALPSTEHNSQRLASLGKST